MADQASGTVCRSCANIAIKAQRDHEESRLLADLEACRAEELVTADQLSNPRKATSIPVIAN